MIQRIQTLWFLVSALFSVLLIPGSFLHFSGKNGSNFQIGFSGLIKTEAGVQQILSMLYPISIIIVLMLSMSLIAVFLYKKRKIQKILSLCIIMLSCILIIMAGYSYYNVISDFSAALTPTVRMVFPVITALAAFLSYRGISRDDKLVKSYDRLR